MAVDNVVRNGMSMIVEDDAVVHDRLGYAVGQIMRVFYVEDGLLGLQDPEWLQGDLNILIGLFHQIGLMANVTKSKKMTYQLGMIWLGMLDEVVG